MNKEKERMLSGKLYQGNDEELVAERAEAKKKCFKINNISPEKSHEIMKNIKELFGEMGENTSVKTPIMCDYGYNISLGEKMCIRDRYITNIFFTIDITDKFSFITRFYIFHLSFL